MTGAPPQSDISAGAHLLGSGPATTFTSIASFIAADGTHTLTGLAPGSYVVSFTGEPGIGGPSPYATAWYPDEPDPGHATTVNVESGQTTPLGVELAEAPGTVTGRVTDLLGAPLTGYFVMPYIAEPNGSQFFAEEPTVVSGSDGTFTLTGLAPGTWTIRASPSGPSDYTQSESAVVQAGAATPNIDFTFCVGTQCPPTHLLALSAAIQNHELGLTGKTSDPASAVLTLVLQGHIGRRRVSVRDKDIQVQGGTFSYHVPLPRRDWALRSGVLTLDFAASQAATGGRFSVAVPSVFPRAPSTPPKTHKPKRKPKRKKRRKHPK